MGRAEGMATCKLAWWYLATPVLAPPRHLAKQALRYEAVAPSSPTTHTGWSIAAERPHSTSPVRGQMHEEQQVNRSCSRVSRLTGAAVEL